MLPGTATPRTRSSVLVLLLSVSLASLAWRVYWLAGMPAIDQQKLQIASSVFNSTHDTPAATPHNGQPDVPDHVDPSQFRGLLVLPGFHAFGQLGFNNVRVTIEIGLGLAHILRRKVPVCLSQVQTHTHRPVAARAATPAAHEALPGQCRLPAVAVRAPT